LDAWDRHTLEQSPNEHSYILEEEGTDRYTDLEMAQAAALHAVVQALVRAIRSRLHVGSQIEELGDDESPDEEGC
jgi:hypothetical protein